MKLTSIPDRSTSGKMKTMHDIGKVQLASIKKSLGTGKETLDKGTEIEKRRNWKKNVGKGIKNDNIHENCQYMHVETYLHA